MRKHQVSIIALVLTMSACAGGESIKPTTTTSVTTTTTVAPTTTTTSTTTTTTTLVEQTPSFLWGGGFAEVGVLRGPETVNAYEFTMVVVAGELISVYREDVELSESEGPIPAWFVELSFGPHPETGEEILAHLLIGFEIDNWYKGVIKNESGRSSWEHYLGRMGPYEYVPWTFPEFIDVLETGRLYPIPMVIGLPSLGICTPRPGDDFDWDHPAIKVECEKFGQLLEPGGLYDALSYNIQLYEAIIGDAEPPIGGFGLGNSIDPVPIWNGPER